jgi:hypothetical protein
LHSAFLSFLQIALARNPNDRRNGFAAMYSRRHGCCYRHYTIRIWRIDNQLMEDEMGKYFLAWILGVPASLLVLVYLFTHIF